MNVYHLHMYKDDSSRRVPGVYSTSGEFNSWYNRLVHSSQFVYDIREKRDLTFSEVFQRGARYYAMSELEHTIKEFSKFQNFLTREQIFEDVRKQSHPEKPSRMKCIYAAQSVEEALLWLPTVNADNLPYQLLELELGSGANFFLTNEEPLWHCQDVPKQDIFKQAERYWSGSKGNKNYEVLFEGQYKILREIAQCP